MCDEERLRKEDPPEYCQRSLCKINACCNSLHACDTSDFDDGFQLRLDAESIVCQGTQRQSYECCDQIIPEAEIIFQSRQSTFSLSS